MKKLALAFLLLSSTAYAADLPVKAASPVAIPLSWTGGYVGINGGGGWATQDQSLGGTNAVGSFAIATGLVPASIATRGGGGMVGGTLGYNYQYNSYIVFGAEFDMDWADIGGSGGETLSGAPLKIPVSVTSTGSEKLKWLGTLRVRAGYLLTPTTFAYATGGLAFGQADSAVNISLSAPAPFAASVGNDSSSTKTGWTIGAGVEQRLWDRWSIKGEYRYVDLGSIGQNLGATIAPTTRFATPVSFNTNQDLRYNIVLIGLNYKFYP